MRSGKVIALLAIGLAMTGMAEARPSFRLAQANPTNDPDVQRGINERNEQERQRKIQECYDQSTAQMNPKPTGADAADIRRRCEFGPMYGGIRG
ncbi:MAG TPA: hypothetical protein VHC39_09930 [Rhizomicrobium sp.]|nr:hypothetical protein [Rhizomicrobium sp.]